MSTKLMFRILSVLNQTVIEYSYLLKTGLSFFCCFLVKVLFFLVKFVVGF